MLLFEIGRRDGLFVHLTQDRKDGGGEVSPTTGSVTVATAKMKQMREGESRREINTGD